MKKSTTTILLVAALALGIYAYSKGILPFGVKSQPLPLPDPFVEYRSNIGAYSESAWKEGQWEDVWNAIARFGDQYEMTPYQIQDSAHAFLKGYNLYPKGYAVSNEIADYFFAWLDQNGYTPSRNVRVGQYI